MSSEPTPKTKSSWARELAEAEARGAAKEQERCCKIIFGQCSSDNVAQRTVDEIRRRTGRKGI